MPNDELTLFDLIEMCWAKKGVIIGATCVGLAAAVAFTVFSPARWQAKATLVMPMPETTPINSPLAAFVGQGASGTIDVLAGLAKSHRSLSEVAAKTNSDPFELDRIIRAEVDAAAGQLVLTAEDTDKAKATSYLKESIVSLDKLAKEVGLSVASRTRSEVGASLANRRAELKAAEERLSTYLSSALTAPDPANPGTSAEYRKAYAEAAINLERVERQLDANRTMAGQMANNAELPTGIPELQTLREQLIAKETELANARIHFAETSREVGTLVKQVNVLKETVRKEVTKRMQAVNEGVDARAAELEATKLVLSWQVGALKRLADAAPKEAAEAARLNREVQTLGSVVNELRMQYEKARIDADVDKVRWSVLEEPYIVEPAVNKRFARAGAFGGGLGFLIACLGVFVANGRRERKAPSA